MRLSAARAALSGFDATALADLVPERRGGGLHARVLTGAAFR